MKVIRLFLILVLLVIAGAAAAFYLQRDKVMGILAATPLASFLPMLSPGMSGAPPVTTPSGPRAASTTAPAAPAAAPIPQEKKMPTYDLTADASGLSKAVATMTLENGGVIKFRFFSNDAPNTVKRIAQLISEGFYNGIKFHRVVPGFVVQAGDPTGTGTGGSGMKLKAEFNSHKHVEGVLSMARTPDPNSADSQFFIMIGAAPHLDGQYTAFGKTIEGLDNVMKIKQGDKIKSWTIQ